MKVRQTKPKPIIVEEITNPLPVLKDDSKNIIIVSETEAKRVAESVGLPAGPLSFTQLSTFLLCPRSYQFKYVQKVPRTGWSDNLIMGGALHVAFEVLGKAKLNGAELNKSLLEQARNALAFTITKNIASTPELRPEDKTLLEAEGKLANKIVEAHFDVILPKLKPQAVEEKLYVLVNGIPLVVIIDLVDDGIIKDYKVTRKTKSQKDAEDSLQLTLYAAVKGATKAGFISCPFPDVTKKKFDPTPTEVVVEKNPGDKQWVLEVLGSIFENIVIGTEKQAFNLCDPSGWKCSEKFCDWWPICRGRYAGNKPITPDWLKAKK